MSTIGDLVVNLKLDHMQFLAGSRQSAGAAQQVSASVSNTNPVLARMSAAERRAGQDALVMAQALKQVDAANDRVRTSSARVTRGLGRSALGGATTQLSFALDDVVNSTGDWTIKLRGAANNISTLVTTIHPVAGILTTIGIASLPLVVNGLTGLGDAAEASKRRLAGLREELAELDEDLAQRRTLQDLDRNGGGGGGGDNLVFGLRENKRDLDALAAEREDAFDRLLGAGNDDSRTVARERIAKIEERINGAWRDRERLQARLDASSRKSASERIVEDARARAAVRAAREETAVFLQEARRASLEVGREIEFDQARRAANAEFTKADAGSREFLSALTRAVSERDERAAAERAGEQEKGPDRRTAADFSIGPASRGSVEAAEAIANATSGTRDRERKEAQQTAKATKETAKNTATIAAWTRRQAGSNPLRIRRGSFDEQ
ncbi:MAG: hypothetical protein AAFZ07_20230 [Actinomycetota bacterium]